MRRRLQRWISAALVALVLPPSIAAVAEGEVLGDARQPESSKMSLPLGGDFPVAGALRSTNDWFPAVAWNAIAGEYLVVWTDGRDEPSRGVDIYGQRTKAGGKLVGSEFRISGADATAHDSSPAVAWNATANEYLVVWQDDRNDVGSDVYGRRVAASGAPVGTDFRVNTTTSGRQAQPAVAWNATANEYLVVWHDGRDFAERELDIYGRRVAADGIPDGIDFRVSSAAAIARDCWPAVVWNSAANEYLVVWVDWRHASPWGSDIYARRVEADGTPVGVDLRISGPLTIAEGAEKDKFFPAVAWNATDEEYLVVWADCRNLWTRGQDIYGQTVASDGSRVGRNFRISGSNATEEDEYPEVVWSGTANQYLVVWVDWRSYSSRGRDIYGQTVASDGSRVGRNFRISGPNATAHDEYPAVAWNGVTNQYLVVWEDEREVPHGRGQDIYGRRLAG